jgi:hypothetical protein
VVKLRDLGEIQSVTFAAGDGGAVTVEAGRLLVTGVPGSGRLSGITSSANPGSSGDAGTVAVKAGEVDIRDEGRIASSTLGRGDAGTVTVRADEVQVSRGGGITTGSTIFAEGDAGTVTVEANALTIRDEGRIASSALGGGSAGDVRLAVGTLLVENAFVATVGLGIEGGGQITVEAEDLVALVDADITSNGIVPAPGASIITFRAPLIALNDSRVLSLTGAGEPLGGSGEARLLGDVTVVSADSEVAASSTVETTGLQTDLGTGLQLAPGAFLDAGSLLGQTCAARRAGKASSFTRAGGGLPPSPDRPLSSGSTAEPTRTASAENRRLVVAGTALSAECDGRPLAGAM